MTFCLGQRHDAPDVRIFSTESRTVSSTALREAPRPPRKKKKEKLFEKMMIDDDVKSAMRQIVIGGVHSLLVLTSRHYYLWDS